MDRTWSLRDLAAETGVSERTIRFYISRGILDPPLRAGRAAAYGEEHRIRLKQIRNLQAGGMMLAEIAHCLDSGPKGPELSFNKNRFDAAAVSERAADLPASETWRGYSLAEDVVVMVRAQAGPWRTKRILSALRGFAALLHEETISVHKEDDDE